MNPNQGKPVCGFRKIYLISGSSNFEIEFSEPRDGFFRIRVQNFQVGYSENLNIKFSFAGFKQPIRHEINKRAAALGNQLQKGFNTAAEVKSFHCDSEKGTMHPRFKPDMSRKDKFGFVLLDKFVSVIGELSDEKSEFILI